MASVHNAIYKRFNGVDWDTFYFATTAGQVAESTTRIWMTPAERTKIADFLTVFNTKGKLVRVDGTSGEIPIELIPGGHLNFLPLIGGTLTGNLALTGTGRKVTVDGTVYDKSGITSAGIVNIKGSSVHVDAPIFTIGNMLTVNNSEVNVHNKRIMNVTDPINATDAANKRYVDMLSAQGTHLIGAVVAASTGDIPTLAGLLTIDGVVLEAENRVLVKNQSTASQNGVYIVNAQAWTKVPNDSDKGSLVSVLGGDSNKRHQYYNEDGTTWVEYWVDDHYGVTVDGGLELDGTGLMFGIKTGGVVNGMIGNNAVTMGKLGTDLDLKSTKFISFTSSEAVSITAATATKRINGHLSNLYKMVQTVKGTANAHTAQSDNISNLKILAAAKNRSFIGSAAPGTTNYVDGDLYFQTSN